MRRLAGSAVTEMWLPVVMIALWWTVSRDSESFFFPPLADIVSSLADLITGANLVDNVLPSLERLVAGYFAAAFAGIAGGVALALSRWTRAAVEPIVHFLRALPPPALLPFAIVAFGIGDTMKVWIIAFGAMFPILLNAMDGVRGTDPVAIETSRAYRLPRSLRIRSVMVPGALPHIFAGLRTGLQVAILLMVVSEMIASTGGIGFYVLQSQQQFAIPEMWAGMLLLGFLGYVLNLLFVVVERRILHWYFATRGMVLR